jgi:drug/metabolite transporter (DMT)-like permease
MAGGVYIISYLCGEVIPMSGFSYYNLRKHSINLAAWRCFAIGFLAGGSNIIGITGNLNLNRQGGETSLLVPLTNLYVVIPVAAGVLCLGDKFTLKKGLGILMGVGATMMFAFGGGSSFDLGNPSTMGFFFMTITGRSTYARY